MDPSKDPPESFASCHRNLSVRRGISNFEHLDLDVLSQEKVYEFLCTWAPLKLVGATDSLGNPLAAWEESGLRLVPWRASGARRTCDV